MSERRLLALLALLLGLLGAVLILVKFLDLPGGQQEFLPWLTDRAIAGFLALVAVVGSLFIYGGKYRAGGIINIVVGIALLFVRGGDTTGGLLIIFSGILGLVAAGTFQQYRPR